MDFFDRQEKSRRTTRVLIVLFTLAFLAVALATAVVVAAVFQFLPSVDQPMLSTTIGNGSRDLLKPFLLTIGVVLALMLIASAGRSAMLSRGGANVARMLGGTEIHGNSSDPLHQRLINVVEEMSIASGVPVPDVFVLESEDAINAFAAGLEQTDAAVAVTRGALERLNRAELQGVIAHEFSHILNGDMRINQRLMGLSFGILVLTLIGRWMMRSMRFARRSREGKGSAIVLVGIALLIIGYIGVLFSRLIKAAISRQREVLADASAVQFTREPEGLAGALRKIGGFRTEFSATESEEVAHMLFGRGSRSFRGLFATHPPLLERIQALDPNFKADDFEKLPQLADVAAHSDAVSGLAPGAASLQPRGDISLEDTGRIESASVGSAIYAAIPEELRESAHSHEASWLLVVALACADDGERQRAFLEQRLGAQRAQMCLRLHADIAPLDMGLRLPLLELCMPALRQRPNAQLQFLLELITDLIAQRSDVSLFDFVLPRVLTAWLGRRADLPTPKSVRPLSHRDALQTLLAAVASFGHDTTDSATAAWRTALSGSEDTSRTIAPDDTALLRDLESAVEKLRFAPARMRRRVLAAVLTVIQYDHEVRTGEAELFRAIAAALDVPAPPLVAGSIKAQS